MEVSRNVRMIKRTIRRILFGTLAATVLVCGSSQLSAQNNSSQGMDHDDVWQIVSLGGQRVGYGRVQVSMHETEGVTIYRTNNELHFTMKRFGQTIQMETSLQTEETADGDLLRYAFETRNPPADSTRSEGEIVGKRLKVKSIVADREQTRTVPWEDDVKSPLYQDRLLSEQPMRPNEVRSYKTFLPELQKVATLKMSAHDYQSVKLYDGTQKRLLKVQIQNSVLPTMVVKAYLDEEGESLKSESDILGMALTTYTVPREVALEEIAGSELDVAIGTLIPVTGLDKGHKAKRIVYRISADDVELSSYIPESLGQKVKVKSENELEVTVTRLPPPKSFLSRNDEEKYLKPSTFLQIDDSLVVDHARKGTASKSTQWDKAVGLEKYVHDNLKQKNFSTALASAAEVAKRMEGDCTEHAVLLAALLRVVQIPSRVVVGLVYAESQQAFAGHMWTEAYFGDQWIPLDATIGRGGIGAAHIKLADAALDDDSPSPVMTFLPLLNVLGKMKIDVIKQD
ncbi:MAG: transglutaminase-like domain-containing protein [Planctomycetota bacterium]|nr:transglutaminase-like domain-containing protein [Planctomycetota bacterium]MDA1213919.1 transglutaminase-like domain-containing protein [Planctomycetota bacterium]